MYCAPTELKTATAAIATAAIPAAAAGFSVLLVGLQTPNLLEVNLNQGGCCVCRRSSNNAAAAAAEASSLRSILHQQLQEGTSSFLVGRLTMDLKQVVVSSALSGSLVALLCTPFDVVKNHSQYSALAAAARAAAAAGSSDGRSGASQATSSSSGRAWARHGGRVGSSSWAVAARLYRAKGVWVFWRGLLPAIGVLVPSNVIFFALYEQRDPHQSNAVAGVGARTVAVICTAPVELVRTQLQASCSSSSSNAAVSLLRHTLRTEGVGGLFKGVVPTIIRDAPFSFFYWPLTAATSKALRRLLRPPESDPSSSSRGKVEGFLEQAVVPFLAGAGSSAVACVLTHPFDVIKTRVQAAQMLSESVDASLGGSDPRAASKASPRPGRRAPLLPLWQLGRGMRDACTDVFRAQGLRGFTVGLVPRLLKIVPSCAVLLGTYEATRALWGSSLLDQM
ncbi:hypothetical protein Esti_005175 [Eimeria stiedai]